MEEQFVVQLKFHGNVDSMNTLMRYIYDNMCSTLPVAKVYPTHLRVLNSFRVHFTQFIPGVAGNKLYYNLPLPARIEIVKQIARAFGTIWDLEIDRTAGMIGEALVSENPLAISVGPERVDELGGPFSSVTKYLEVWIHHCIRKLEKAHCIEEFQEDVLPSIRQMVKKGLNIPFQVEEVPIVISHEDMSLDNMIFSLHEPHSLQAIIDWEQVGCMPFATSVPTYIEPLFWNDSKGKQNEHNGHQALRDSFWDEIPEWKTHVNSEATRIFLDWYRFGHDIYVSPPINYKPTSEQKREIWKDNTRAALDFLKRYTDESSDI